MKNSEIVKKVKQEIIKRSNEFEKQTKGTKDEYNIYNEHIKYVYKNAMLLSENKNVDREVLAISALLHDIAMTDSKLDRSKHNEYGSLIAGELLKKENYPEEKIELVKKCILNHSNSRTSFRTTKEEKILVDADGLAHFDSIKNLYSLAHSVIKLNDEDTIKYIQNKLTKDYNEISDDVKTIVKDKYQKVMNARSINDILNIFIEEIDEFKNNRDKHLKEIRSKLTNKDFSLITNNCLAGFIYHDLGLKFLTPTINLRIKPKEFIAFVSDLKYYLNKEVKEVKSDGDIPLGIIEGDENHISVNISFDHYKSFEEAKNKWFERSKRVNYDNIYVMMEYYDGIHTQELIDLFKDIPYKNKMILTHKDHKEDFTSAIHCFDDSTDMAEIGGKIFRYDGLTGKRFYEEFDYISFLNKK